MRSIVYHLLCLVVPVWCSNATYNSFREQVGFCRMQSYKTLSRGSSTGCPMFLDGRVTVGVGLSQDEFRDVSSCGRCLLVTGGKNIWKWDHELVSWETGVPIEYPFVAMVFDQCTDPVCHDRFLDFDVYSPTQPVERGNPYDLVWEYTDCPVHDDEPLEVLWCFDTACNVPTETLSESSYYWSITVRNSRRPFQEISVEYDRQYLPLRKENGWVWDHGVWHLNQSMSLRLTDLSGQEYTVSFTTDGSRPLPEYYGGVLMRERLHSLVTT